MNAFWHKSKIMPKRWPALRISVLITVFVYECGNKATVCPSPNEAVDFCDNAPSPRLSLLEDLTHRIVSPSLVPQWGESVAQGPAEWLEYIDLESDSPSPATGGSQWGQQTQREKADFPRAAPLPSGPHSRIWLFYWEPQSVPTSRNFSLCSMHLRDTCVILYVSDSRCPTGPLLWTLQEPALHLLLPITVAVLWVPVD